MSSELHMFGLVMSVISCGSDLVSGVYLMHLWTVRQTPTKVARGTYAILV